jgi:integrase
MKASRIHRVPLSGRGVAILKKLEKIRGCEFVFPGRKPGRPLSNLSMETVFRRMKVENATMHGFRSSFREWVGNKTPFPREIAEAALAHVASDAAEQAYRRRDALEKRRQLMEAWAKYCDSRSEALTRLRTMHDNVTP